jgi:hypothetical protein
MSSTVKVQNQSKGLVYRAQVMVLQETRIDAVNAIDTIAKAVGAREFQKLSPAQLSALSEVRRLLIDLKPNEKTVA